VLTFYTDIEVYPVFLFVSIQITETNRKLHFSESGLLEMTEEIATSTVLRICQTKNSTGKKDWKNCRKKISCMRLNKPIYDKKV
jgi:hypothetical protein